MLNDTKNLILEIASKLANRHKAAFAAVSRELNAAAILAERDEQIILELALRPPVQVTFDAAPNRLDLLKN